MGWDSQDEMKTKQRQDYIRTRQTPDKTYPRRRTQREGRMMGERNREEETELCG